MKFLLYSLTFSSECETSVGTRAERDGLTAAYLPKSCEGVHQAKGFFGLLIFEL
jgi:hypothetical protein